MYRMAPSSYYNTYSNKLYPQARYPPPPQVYPQDIQCVLPSNDPTKGAIYISNVEAAQNPKTLAKHQIKAVMTCAKGYHKNIPKTKIDFFEYFPCEDKDQCPISIYFEQAVNFIVKALKHTNILVHCIAGVSRSVSMVLAYLIRQKNMSYDEAYLTVKRRRKIICPNDGFIRQLRQYQKKTRDTLIRTTTGGKSDREPRETRIKSYQTPKTETKFYKQNSPINQEDEFNQYKYEPKDRQSVKQSKELDQLEGLKKTATFHQIPEEGPNITRLGKSMVQIDISNKKIDNYVIKTPEKRYNYQMAEQQTKNRQKKGEKTESRTAYFQQMNRQLNEKIAAIHAKYQNQRQKIYSKKDYLTPTKTTQNKFDKYNLSTQIKSKNNKYSIDKTDRKPQNKFLRQQELLNRKTHGFESYQDTYKRNLSTYDPNLYSAERFKYAGYVDDKYGGRRREIGNYRTGYRGFLY